MRPNEGHTGQTEYPGLSGQSARSGQAGQAWPPGLLARCLAGHRRRGHRIVFTNGCFDVLHRGHVECLQQAAALGDVLVVGLNSDASVRRLKGPGRPVNPEGDRAAVVAALGCVHYVTVFGEDTPERLLSLVRPDLYVKGGDYDLAALPERPLVERHGGRVVTVGYLPGRSTTRIAGRIRAAAGPAGEAASEPASEAAAGPSAGPSAGPAAGPAARSQSGTPGN